MDKYIWKDKKTNAYEFELSNGKINNFKEIGNKMKKLYPYIGEVALTYLKKTELKDIANNDNLRIEIPKDVIRELLDGTAEFIRDSDGMLLPSIRDKQSKNIIRQVRLKIIDNNKEESKIIDSYNLDKLNNIVLHKFMEKMYDEILDMKETINDIRITQKNDIRSRIDSGIIAFLLSKDDSEENKKYSLIGARQTIINGISILRSEVQSNKKYFEDAMKLNPLVRSINLRKYGTKKIEYKSKEFDEDVKYLLMGTYTLLEIEKELGNFENKKEKILSYIDDVLEIKNSCIMEIMPYSLERELIYSNIKDLKNNGIYKLDEEDKLLIDMRIINKEGEQYEKM